MACQQSIKVQLLQHDLPILDAPARHLFQPGHLRSSLGPTVGFDDADDHVHPIALERWASWSIS